MSGLNQHLAKVSYGQPYPEFESRRFRHIKSPCLVHGLFYFNSSKLENLKALSYPYNSVFLPLAKDDDLKKLVVAFMCLCSFSAFSSVYIETDLLAPTLNIAGSTRESQLNVIVGYEFEKWDISLRYYEIRGISYTGGYGGSSSSIGSISISDAEDV